MPRTRLYCDGRLAKQDFPVEDISEYLNTPGAVLWLDLCSPTRAEMELAAEEFDLHELAVEDALHEAQRPKLDRYDTHSFLSAYSAHLDANTGELALSEIAAFITRNALITVRKDDGFRIDDVVARWDATTELAPHGVSYLLYGLLDHIVDGHFLAVQELDDEMERLEELLFDTRPHGIEVQRRSFEIRKSLVTLRRVVLPMREAVNTIMRRNIGIVDADMLPYFQDVYDHVLRASEWTESLRDLVSTILGTHLTIQGNRLNLIMKKVTSWAAIIAVPTAITGFYGQNVLFPGFNTAHGFIASTLLIIVFSVGLYVLFRRNDWI